MSNFVEKNQNTNTTETSSADNEEVISISSTVYGNDDDKYIKIASSETLLKKLENLADKKNEWQNLSASVRLALLDEIMDRMHNNLDMYHQAALIKRNFIRTESFQKKLVDTYAAAGTLNWLQSAGLLGAWLSVIREYLESIVRTGSPPKPAKISKNYDNTSTVTMNLTGVLMKLLATFGTIEMHVEGNVEQENFLQKKGGVAVVLGAGNYDAPIDLLTAMFVENKVCIYKFSPLSQVLSESLEHAFYPLVKNGYLMFLHGDVQEGNLLLNHPKVDKWFLTGSATTANKILWGNPEAPISLNEKAKIDKECMLELGNCTPWIVCPAQWSNFELNCHAKHMAMAMLYNGGHICVHPQIIITSKNWPQREQFLTLLRQYQEATPVIGCFYANYKEKIEAARASLIAEGKSEEEFSLKVNVANNYVVDPQYSAVLFATDLKTSTFLTKEEMFCSVSGEIPLDVNNSFEEFLEAAVKFCNESCYGNLAVSISAKSCNDSQRKALDKAIIDLKYGSVSINAFPLMTITFPNLVWGAYPGGNIHRFESGIGFLGNCFGFKRPIKSVFRAPFLNMCHLMMILPTKFTCNRLSKTWRRASYALYDRRGSAQSYWNSFANTVKIGSAMIFNL